MIYHLDKIGCKAHVMILFQFKIYYFYFKFYWSIVVLQCCVISSMLQNDSVMHIYVFFSMWFITGYRVWFPVLYSWALLFIGITHASLHLPVPNSQSIRPHPPSSLASIRLFSVSVSLFHRSVHLCHILDSTC